MVKTYTPIWTEAFNEDKARLDQMGYDMSLLKDITDRLILGKRLPRRYQDHKLSRPWLGYNGPHISDDPDWILVYKYEGDKVIFDRTGSHEEIYQTGSYGDKEK
jgi:mRNA interferase YafQ